MRLQGKVALVTGSAQGIGRAIVERFAREGADVVVNYRSGPAMAEEVVQAARAAGVRAVAIQADVAQVGDVRRLVEQAVAEMGRLDVLVNNAGVETHAPFWDVTEADYDKVLDVNLKGVVLRDAGDGPASAGHRASGPDRQHQLGARGAAVSELRRLLRVARAA